MVKISVPKFAKGGIIHSSTDRSILDGSNEEASKRLEKMIKELENKKNKE